MISQITSKVIGQRSRSPCWKKTQIFESSYCLACVDSPSWHVIWCHTVTSQCLVTSWRDVTTSHDVIAWRHTMACNECMKVYEARILTKRARCGRGVNAQAFSFCLWLCGPLTGLSGKLAIGGWTDLDRRLCTHALPPTINITGQKGHAWVPMDHHLSINWTFEWGSRGQSPRKL